MDADFHENVKKKIKNKKFILLVQVLSKEADDIDERIRMNLKLTVRVNS